MALMAVCLHRCGVAGLQRSLCLSAARLQDAAESTTTSEESSKDFRSVTVLCHVDVETEHFVPSFGF